jgi:hypothetical protein
MGKNTSINQNLSCESRKFYLGWFIRDRLAGIGFYLNLGSRLCQGIDNPVHQ